MKIRVDRELTSGGIEDSTQFDLSQEDASHIMTILRDTLYSDRILAVLREYSANAWDAHRMAGKADLPIKVTLPTDEEPTLVIRDFGPGLSRADVFNVYTKYGKSTKRDTDNAVGMLGIGSKSGFAYSDSFTVTSWFGGTKSLYVAVLDKSDKGTMNLMHEEPCDLEETGIEIQIAVNPKDIGVFKTRARHLFQHFVPRPDINLDLPELPTSKYDLKNGFLYINSEIDYDDQGWMAVMGCVPYKIDLNKVRDVTPGIGENAYGLSGVLYFDIGDVHINASREELKYNDATKQAIVTKVNALVDEFVSEVLKTLDVKATQWERRCEAEILRRLNLPVLEKILLEGIVHLPKDDAEPKHFFLSCPDSTSRVESIKIHGNTRLFIHDSPRAIKGYNLNYNDRIVRRRSGSSVEDVEKELSEVIQTLGIEGIPVKRLSEMEWVKTRVSYSGGGGVYNAKHAKTMFRLRDNPNFHRPLSRDWEVIEHEPSDDDVFVILDRFEAYGSFSTDIRQDKALCATFIKPFPKVLGYKSTEKKPVNARDCKGKHYREWRAALRDELLKDPKAVKLLETYRYHKAMRVYIGYYDRKRYDQLPKLLGKEHPISQWLERRDNAEKAWDKLDHATKVAIEGLASIQAEDTMSEADDQLQAIKKTYPLLFRSPNGDMSDLWDDDAALWIEYVQLIDKVSAITTLTSEEDHDEDSVHPDQRVDQRRVGGEDPHGSEERRELRVVAGGAAG